MWSSDFAVSQFKTPSTRADIGFLTGVLFCSGGCLSHLSSRTLREVPSGEPQCPGLSRHVRPPRRLPRLSASVWPARSPPSDRQTGIGSFGCDKPVSLEKALLRDYLTGFSGSFSIPRGENDGPACSACRHQRVSAAPTPSRTRPSRGQGVGEVAGVRPGGLPILSAVTARSHRPHSCEDEPRAPASDVRDRA